MLTFLIGVPSASAVDIYHLGAQHHLPYEAAAIASYCTGQPVAVVQNHDHRWFDPGSPLPPPHGLRAQYSTNEQQLVHNLTRKDAGQAFDHTVFVTTGANGDSLYIIGPEPQGHTAGIPALAEQCMLDLTQPPGATSPTRTYNLFNEVVAQCDTQVFEPPVEIRPDGLPHTGTITPGVYSLEAVLRHHMDGFPRPRTWHASCIPRKDGTPKCRYQWLDLRRFQEVGKRLVEDSMARLGQTTNPCAATAPF
jgi:hypothetical protein